MLQEAIPARFPKISRWLGVLHVEYLQEEAPATSAKISGFKSCSAHPQIAEQGLEDKE